MPDKTTVAIIGASGFIGGRLVEWLTLRDLAEIRPIVRSYKSMARLARFNLDCRLADATDQSALETQLKGCEVLFHCVVGQRDAILKSAESAYRAAANAGVRRIIYLSSAMVHSPNPALGTNDDSVLVSRQPFTYNVSKVMAEHLLRRLRKDNAVEVVTLRPMIVFGPRSQLFTVQIAMDLLSGKAYLVDEGSGICNTVYVDNLVYAMWQAAVVEKAGNQDFIITDGERVTWLELYRSVAEVVGVNISRVPCIHRGELKKIFREQRSAHIKTTTKRFGWAIRESLPSSLISTVKGILPSGVAQVIKPWWKSLQTTGVQAAITEDLALPRPIIDRELAAWQTCSYMLPIEKAQKVLGYKPPLTFSESSRRTGEWLRFVFGQEDANNMVFPR